MAQIALENKNYSYGDYLNWPDEERWELIEGVPYDMTPAPSTNHQRIAVELLRQISTFLFNRDCEVFIAPFDVRLPEGDEADEQIFSVVQPDIAVICDPAKIDGRGCRGTPDFIIEILSPSTAAKDQIQKVALYEKHGVKELWIVHPGDKLVFVRLLQDGGGYGIPKIYEGKGRLPVTILPGLEIDMDYVFRSLPSEN
jgi:Uma2 family endonuclease